MVNFFPEVHLRECGARIKACFTRYHLLLVDTMKCTHFAVTFITPEARRHYKQNCRRKDDQLKAIEKNFEFCETI